MSGLYLIVWDDEQYNRILHPTYGGYPHLTVAYTGKNLDVSQLKSVATTLLLEYTMKQVTLEEAYLNSFQKDDGTWRHDCLIRVDRNTTEMVNQTRNILKMEY